MINQKKYGQYFTNRDVADFMVNWTMECSPKNLLDPAVGKGVFLEETLKNGRNIDVTAFDIDANMCNIIDSKYSAVKVKNKDYLTSRGEFFDAIICNPPYNKFQKIKNRKNLIDIFKKKYDIKLSGYSNLCIYFLIKSMQELTSNGRCCYIIPYEFLNTNYGKQVKKYLLESKKLVAIIKFNNSLNLFDDAITTSCILLIENKIHTNINFISIEDVKELKNINKLKNIITYDSAAIDPNVKWLQYFDTEKSCSYSNIISLKNIAQVKRGIATGNNKYFSLNNKKIEELGLSPDVCLPCITKSADIVVPILSKIEFEKLVALNKNMFLFNGIKSTKKNDFKYIEHGENNNYNKTYLTSHRTPWFSIENKEPAPILLSVFSRDKIKVIRNKAMIRNLTTFHGLYFKNKLSEEYINIYFCYLLTPIAQQVLYLNKREYGDGLDKFEPNDLNNAFVLDINVVTSNDKTEILTIYKNLNTTNLNESILNLNRIFKSYLISA